MTNPDTTLRLRHDREHQSSGAWYIAGSDASLWLEEIVRWRVPMAELRLFVLPRSAADRSPEGVLVISGERPRAVRRAQSYRCVGEKLYLPAGARLEPPLATEEVQERVSGDVLVFHPGVGLVGFGTDEELRVVDLLARPPVRYERWDRARPGEMLAPRLLSVMPDETPQADEVIESGRGIINTRRLDRLPLKPREKTKELASKTRRRIVRGFGRSTRSAMGRIQRLGQLLGRLAGSGRGRSRGSRHRSRRTRRTSSGPGLFTFLDGWASRLVSETLRKEREGELDRLLKAIDADPDRGLRYAPPLADTGSRGIAPPSSQLSRRELRFALDRLSTNHPIDRWDLSPALYIRLTEKYRDLAKREEELGRYRRAAYIYAELLGDYEAAAGALEKGEFYREAAVLFRDRVKQPLRAARCLERGGLLEEAAIAYEKLLKYMNAGDLFLRLGRDDEAKRLYRLEVAAASKSGNDISAAHVLETKLAAPEEALAQLSRAWPTASQAEECLIERFALLGRLGRHDVALDTLRTLGAGDLLTLPANRNASLVKALATTARRYPDDSTRFAASDLARVVAGKVLPWATISETDNILNALRELEPRDRLLARDVDHYRSQLSLRNRIVETAAVRNHGPVTIQRLFALPQNGRWLNFVSIGDTFLAAGVVSGRLAAARCTWSGEAVAIQWGDIPLAGSIDSLMFAAQRTHRVPAILTFYGALRPEMKTLRLAHHPLEIGTPPWLPDKTLGFCYNDKGILYNLCLHNDLFTLETYFKDRILERTSVTEKITGTFYFNIPTGKIAARQDRVYFPFAQHLAEWGHKSQPRKLVEGQVLSVACAPEPANWLVATSMAHGCVVTAPRDRAGSEIVFADDLEDAIVQFIYDNQLVVAGTGEGRIYDFSGSDMRLRASFPTPREPPKVVLRTHNLGEFAIVTGHGKVHLYKVSGL